MSSSSRIPKDVDEASARLLARAYDLASPEETRKLYRDWAETYDTTMLDGLGYMSPQLVAQVLADHLPDKSAHILDIGSGTGLAGVKLAEHGFTKIDALDFSSDMLAMAAKRNIYTDLIECDLTQILPLPDAHWDGAVCSGTFTHGHVGPSCLAEIFRVLKSGSLFAFTVNKGVWQDMGFDTELKKLESNNIARLLKRHETVNYQSATEPDSILNLYQKP